MSVDVCARKPDAFSQRIGSVGNIDLEAETWRRALLDAIRPIIRIGIAMGEVLVADSTMTGEQVILAQRLEQLAEPGGVCIQDAVYQTLPKPLPVHYVNLGERDLKGFEVPVRVYAIMRKRGPGSVSTSVHARQPTDKPSITDAFPARVFTHRLRNVPAVLESSRR